MSILRAHAEQVLIRRLGAVLTAAGLDGVSASGTNPDLTDPLGWALRQMGLAAASLIEVSSSDLAQVSAADTDKLLDLAELRALETASAALAGFVDISVGPRRESLSQMAAQVNIRITAKRAQIENAYNLGGSVLTSGVIEYDFIETGADDA